MLNDAQQFQYLCFHTEIDVEKWINEASLPSEKKHHITYKWLVSNVCRYCEKEITNANEFSITSTYWSSLWAPCHKKCKDAGIKMEAYLCQTLDRDCNDCKHFVREKMIYPNVISGQCKKFEKETIACPNFCSNRECFLHRRD